MKKLLIVCALCCADIGIALAALDGAKIDQITGLKGNFNDKEGVYKITWPRGDVKVVVDGGDAAFHGTRHLGWDYRRKRAGLDDGRYGSLRRRGESGHVGRARSGLERDGVAQSLFLRPTEGLFHAPRRPDSVEKLAMALRKVYDKIKEIRAANPTPRNTFAQKSLGEKSSVTAAPLNEIFGMPGRPKMAWSNSALATKRNA